MELVPDRLPLEGGGRCGRRSLTQRVGVMFGKVETSQEQSPPPRRAKDELRCASARSGSSLRIVTHGAPSSPLEGEEDSKHHCESDLEDV